MSGPHGDSSIIAPSLQIGCNRPTPSTTRLLKALQIMIMTCAQWENVEDTLATATVSIKKRKLRLFSPGLKVYFAVSLPLICLFGKARRRVLQRFSLPDKNKWALSNFNYNAEYAKAPHLLVSFCSKWESILGVFSIRLLS